MDGLDGVTVLELMEGSGDVAGHGELHSLGLIVPQEGEAAAFVVVPVGGNGIYLLQAR
jgi:hypothetical protein